MASVDFARVVDDGRLGRFQVTVLGLCALAALLDGFDTQAIGYTAPAIAKALALAPAALGPVFAAGTLGITIGAFALGPLADRIGRRVPLIGCVLWFAAMTLATTQVTSLPQLLALRLLAGLGLGGAMPSFIAMTAEYTPARMRNVVVAGVYAAFPGGGLLAGLLCAAIIPRFGWEPVFIVGGAAPLALAALLVALLPESAHFLVARGRRPDEVRRIANRIGGVDLPPDTRFTVAETVTAKSVAALFAPGLATRTLLLWVPFFMVYAVLFTVGVWSTTLLRQAGVGETTSLVIVSLYFLGAVTGSILIGRVMDRTGPYAVLAVGFAVGAAFLAGFGQSTASVPLMAVLLAAAGVCIAGAASGLIAVAAQVYPTHARSTGVGWAMGVGRFGQILGPLGIAALVANGWNAQGIFVTAAAPCLIAAVFMMLLRMQSRVREAVPAWR